MVKFLCSSRVRTNTSSTCRDEVMNIHEETTWREREEGAVRVVTNLLVHAETVEVFDSSLRGDLSVDWQLHWVEDWVVLVAWEEAG